MREEISLIFSKVSDPRVEGRCDHRLSDILFIAFCTLLSNGEDFEDMVEFGKQRRDWLAEILYLENGIPSHDTFNRVLQIIDPEQLSELLSEDASGLLDHVRGKLISLDGKKMRGVSPTSRGNKGLYILSAWVGEHRLCLGQKRVNDKSNEITAIPELIDALDIEGGIVSIDAMGCQTQIATKIISSKADYLLAVKENQGGLYEEVTHPLSWSSVKKVDEQWEYDHGRYETRSCQMVEAAKVLSPLVLSKWEGLQTIVKIISERTIKGVSTSHTRYYISSQTESMSFYNESVRNHWGIENQLHWHLDVTFKEDANRSRSGNAPVNMNILRKMALQKIARMKDKLSLKKRRFRASMNVKYLYKVLDL